MPSPADGTDPEVGGAGALHDLGPTLRLLAALLLGGFAFTDLLTFAVGVAWLDPAREAGPLAFWLVRGVGFAVSSDGVARGRPGRGWALGTALLAGVLVLALPRFADPLEHQVERVAFARAGVVLLVVAYGIEAVLRRLERGGGRPPGPPLP